MVALPINIFQTIKQQRQHFPQNYIYKTRVLKKKTTHKTMHILYGPNFMKGKAYIHTYKHGGKKMRRTY